MSEVTLPVEWENACRLSHRLTSTACYSPFHAVWASPMEVVVGEAEFVWNPQSDSLLPLRDSLNRKGSFTTMVSGANSLLFVGTSQRIETWSLTERAGVAAIDTAPVKQLALSKSRKLLAVQHEGLITVREIKNLKSVVSSVNGPKSTLLDTDFARNVFSAISWTQNDLLAISHWLGEVHIFDPRGKTATQVLYFDGPPITSVAGHPWMDRLAIANTEGGVRIVDWNTGDTAQFSIGSHIHSVAFSSDGLWLGILFDSGRFQLRIAPEWVVVAEKAGETESRSSFQFFNSTNSEILLPGSDRFGACIWSLRLSPADVAIREKLIANLPARYREALVVYEHVCPELLGKSRGKKRVTFREAYDFIEEQQGDNPWNSYRTFETYLSKAFQLIGEPVNTPRSGR